MSPDEISAAPRSLPGPSAVPSPSGTSLAAVIDSAIMAIRAVADTIKEKEDALGSVRSQLASVEDDAQVQSERAGGGHCHCRRAHPHNRDAAKGFGRGPQ